MKAVYFDKFGDESVLKFETNIPKPEITEANQVLIGIKSTAVNPHDVNIRSGLYGPVKFPYIPGMDAAGIIEAIGSEVNKFKTGDRVYTTLTGGKAYAEYVVNEDHNVFNLPPQLTFQQGAAIGNVYFTAYRAMFHKGSCKAGETVFIHGASGGVGIACVQMARAYGMQVIGTAGTEEGLANVRKEGAHFAVNHNEEGYMQKIKELTNGRGVDAVMEMNANLNLSKDFDVLCRGGRIVVIGRHGNVNINPRDIMIKEAKILGIMLSHSNIAERREMGAAFHEGIEKGWLRPIIWKEFPLEEASEAQRLISSKQGTKGRIILNV